MLAACKEFVGNQLCVLCFVHAVNGIIEQIM